MFSVANHLGIERGHNTLSCLKKFGQNCKFQNGLCNEKAGKTEKKNFLSSNFAPLWLLWRLCFENYLTPQFRVNFSAERFFWGVEDKAEKENLG